MSNAPQYRFRGNVKPSAAVARPVTCRRNQTIQPSGDSPAAATTSSATLDIFDVIDSFGGWWGISARDVDDALAQIGDVDTLYVRVNSPGGEATEGVAIANMLRAFPAEVRITVIGLAASAASYISLAGDVVSMAPGSMLMIHDPWGFAMGSADDMRAEANALEKLAESIASLYVVRAGGTVAQWQTLMDAETWYTADDAVKAKLADRVGIDPAPSPIAAEADPMDELIAEIEGAFDLAASRFDLSVFNHAPSARAQARTKTPAEPPVNPYTPKEADAMSDTLTKGLRERLGVTDESIDDAGLLSALDEALAETTDGAAQANAANPELAVLRRELDSAQTQLRNLSDARQRDEDAAKAETKKRIFDAAFARGAVHPADHPERVQDEADYDAAPEVMARVLDGRADNSRFPAKATGSNKAPTEADAADGDSWFPQFSGKPKVEA